MPSPPYPTTPRRQTARHELSYPSHDSVTVLPIQVTSPKRSLRSHRFAISCHLFHYALVLYVTRNTLCAGCWDEWSNDLQSCPPRPAHCKRWHHTHQQFLSDLFGLRTPQSFNWFSIALIVLIGLLLFCMSAYGVYILRLFLLTDRNNCMSVNY